MIRISVSAAATTKEELNELINEACVKGYVIREILDSSGTVYRFTVPSEVTEKVGAKLAERKIFFYTETV